MGKRAKRRVAVEREFEGLELGDERRDRRGRRLAAKLASAPGASLPEAMGNEADLEAAYRHLSNDGVDVGSILLPHVLETARRVREAEFAYCLHDTSGFVFGGQSRRRGLGKVHKSDDQGFRAHVSLAVARDGLTPLGLLALGTATRSEAMVRSEGARWSQGIEAASSHFEDPGTLIHVADREGDIYELLADAIAKDWRFIIRAAQNRLVDGDCYDGSTLWDAAASAESRFERTVPLSARSQAQRPPAQKRAFPVRRSRQAVLHFAATPVRIRRPRKRRRSLPDAVAVNVVRVWEPDPPEGEPAVEWLLLTTEPIRTRKHILSVVDGYRTRWLIELYFGALKTGCAFERRQLETAHSLFNLLGYCAVVAYAMLLLRALARDSSGIPARHVLTTQQLRCLRLMTEGKTTMRISARAALEAIAALGGHLRSNGPPGWRTLSRGWQKLLDFEAAYVLIHRLEKSDQS